MSQPTLDLKLVRLKHNIGTFLETNERVGDCPRGKNVQCALCDNVKFKIAGHKILPKRNLPKDASKAFLCTNLEGTDLIVRTTDTTVRLIYKGTILASLDLGEYLSAIEGTPMEGTLPDTYLVDSFTHSIMLGFFKAVN